MGIWYQRGAQLSFKWVSHRCKPATLMIIFCQNHTKCSSHWCHIITNIMVKYHVLSIWLYSFLCNILAIKRYYQYVPHSLCFGLSQGFELQIQVVTQSGFAVFYSWNITNNNLITFIFVHETWCLTRTPKKKRTCYTNPVCWCLVINDLAAIKKTKPRNVSTKKNLWFQVAKRKRRQYHFESGIFCTLYVSKCWQKLIW